MATVEPRFSKTLHVYVAAAHRVDGRAGMGIVFVDAHGRVLRRIGRTLPGVSTRDVAAFRGIIYALWNSRRLGSRSVVVHSDATSAVEQINGAHEVDPLLVGPYLEVRALLHAYRGARVTADTAGWGQEASAVAEAALDHNTDDTIEDLPLWASQETLEYTTA